MYLVRITTKEEDAQEIELGIDSFEKLTEFIKVCIDNGLVVYAWEA